MEERFTFSKHLSATKLFNPSLFQENANHVRLPSTEIEEIIEAHPFQCIGRLTTKLSVLCQI
jgi:hypothetical protein